SSHRAPVRFRQPGLFGPRLGRRNDCALSFKHADVLVPGRGHRGRRREPLLSPGDASLATAALTMKAKAQTLPTVTLPTVILVAAITGALGYAIGTTTASPVATAATVVQPTQEAHSASLPGADL